MKVIILDTTCSKLGWVWRLGTNISGADKVIEAISWGDAFYQLKDIDRIDELQVWSHGNAGGVLIGKTWLTVESSDREHKDELAKLAEKLHPKSIVWLRSCRNFHGHRGHSFARRLRDTLSCRIVGHTYNIGLWHGGMREVRPGVSPFWPVEEGGAVNSSWRSKPVVFFTTMKYLYA